MMSFEEALKIALDNGCSEKELNYCMEFPEFFCFSLKRKDGVRSLGDPHCYIVKENGNKFFNPIMMIENIGRNILEDEIIKEGYLEEFRKAN